MMFAIKIKDNKKESYPWVLLVFVVIFFGIILHIYLPNMGGTGLSLPFNIISGFFIAFFIVMISITQIKNLTLYYSKSSNYITIGLVLLLGLCFFAPENYQLNAYLTAYWLLGALFFYQALLQINISETVLKIIVCSVLFAAIIESLYSIAQVFNFFPISGDRPYGVFQQVNVLSSFICVGIASAIGMFILMRTVTRYAFAIIIVSLILMSMVLPLSQSLTGYLNLLLIVIVFYFFAKYHRQYIVYSLIAIVIGLIIGYGIKVSFNISDFSESKLQTSHIRWVLWQHSLYLFSENILFGSGVGSFESVFLERFGGGLLGTSEKVISHPHNEILRWMVEGGLVGIAAILLVIIGGVHLLYSSLKNKNNNYVFLVIALPIVFHMMTEFPLWLSIPHGVVLILLIRCADVPTKKYSLNKFVGYFSKTIIALGGLLSMGLLYFTLQTQQYLTYIEKTGQQYLLSMNEPDYSEWKYYLIDDRYKLDLNMGYLLRYNETQDPYYLNLFSSWAENYSRSCPDLNVYFSWILVLNELGEKEKTKSVKEKAIFLFDNNEKLEGLNF
ncbi:O-antigen ligase family protein [Providencia rettgeri]|uniref:Wzy polymerase domain-containing protein n=5 Tax=Morganellaceae TaxID=1903414 RepID=A0AB35LEJ7_PRORE|nr:MULTISPECIES: O-antigen ligase family protein [Providencia]ELR5289577.1 O-antigen ligase family protein [Providencia rettgeri]MBG5921896.1 O-antigen ligase family protein [Providencia rettgeri]MBO8253973.1 O-antigen ligase family protein [Providencia rettgeri]MBO8257817.1 O-antigen ligase family protein [Providencia rettgeri]MBQ0398752.1 O-antigen ligase family protein [Providencia rettgeri]